MVHSWERISVAFTLVVLLSLPDVHRLIWGRRWGGGAAVASANARGTRGASGAPAVARAVAEHCSGAASLSCLDTCNLAESDSQETRECNNVCLNYGTFLSQCQCSDPYYSFCCEHR